LQRRSSHSHAPTSPPPTHQESHAKAEFNTRFAGLNLEHYSSITRSLLRRAYPKVCPHCETEMLGDVAARENALRCKKCHFQSSRTAYTPLHHLKLPLWTFGYLFTEAIHTFPQMIPAAQIRRRLGVSHSTSLLLKRRLQLFLSDLVPAIREILAQETVDAFSGLKLPENQDISAIVANKPVVHTDTLALFSATQRSNGGRSRWRHTGQTASIYLSDKVAEQRGKFQIGTLSQTVAVKQGAILLTSIRDQTQRSIEPALSFLPRDTAIMSDEGTPWLSRYYPNHRAINHSARAKDKKRSKWARNRWSKNGVHNQVAEGNQRMVKHAFLAAYGYFQPEFSQLYLNEYSALKSIRVYGFDRLVSLSKRLIVGNVDDRYSPPSSGTSDGPRPGYLRQRITELRYVPPTLRDRKAIDHSDSRRQIRGKLRAMLDSPEYFRAKQAHLDYLTSWNSLPPYRKQNEKQYNAAAHAIWAELHRFDDRLSYKVADKTGQPHRLALRILRKWAKLGLIEAREIQTSHVERRKRIFARRLVTELPDFLYSWDLDEFRNQSTDSNRAKIEASPSDPTQSNKYGMNRKERSKFIKEMKR
jgi:transposase-like protein